MYLCGYNSSGYLGSFENGTTASVLSTAVPLAMLVIGGLRVTWCVCLVPSLCSRCLVIRDMV